MPRVLKQVVGPGTFWIRGEPVEFTPKDIEHFRKQGKSMIDVGLPIRVPLEHQDWADPYDDDERKAKDVLYNKGFVADYIVDDDDTLWAVLDIPDEAFARKLQTEVKYVSPRILPEFVDGDGREWKNVIAHVALTPQPVWHDQKPFGAKPEGFTLREARADMAISMSIAASKGTPLDLSMSCMAVPIDDDRWIVGPRHEIDMAVEWKQGVNQKTGKTGWYSVGGKGRGQGRYSDPTKDRTGSSAGGVGGKKAAVETKSKKSHAIHELVVEAVKRGELDKAKRLVEKAEEIKAKEQAEDDELPAAKSTKPS
ncbi:MAG TPA: hypothetical protein PJ982_17410 [Lacipirellulaceae bacterium]|nr:hypothetical protein [Lacipirellulaceae bacterium]